MISLDATSRDNKTKGQLSAIRNSGSVPAIIYGGKDKNEKISISKKLLKITIEKEIFDLQTLNHQMRYMNYKSLLLMYLLKKSQQHQTQQEFPLPLKINLQLLQGVQLVR